MSSSQWQKFDPANEPPHYTTVWIRLINGLPIQAYFVPVYNYDQWTPFFQIPANTAYNPPWWAIDAWRPL